MLGFGFRPRAARAGEVPAASAPGAAGAPTAQVALAHLLELRDFCVAFRQRSGEPLEAVHRVDLTVDAGEVVGIVGESGCGKSVLAQSIVRLLEHERPMAYSGQVLLDGRDLLELPLKRMREVRGRDIAMVFQDPLSSLNPVMSVGAQVVEAVRAHRSVSRADARACARDLLERVGIARADARMGAFPGDLSGGMRQRVMIAMALAQRPRLLIADEPTTALDTTTQRQILDLLRRLNREEGMAVLLISHDLGVVRSVCDRVNVMYLGEVVERISAEHLMEAPAHPYTQGLVASIPPLSGRVEGDLPSIPGTVPPLTAIPAGCRFSPRCPFAADACRQDAPAAYPLPGGGMCRCGRAAGATSGGAVPGTPSAPGAAEPRAAAPEPAREPEGAAHGSR